MPVGKQRLWKSTVIVATIAITVLSIVGLYIQTGYVRYTDVSWGQNTTIDASSIEFQSASIIAQVQTNQPTRLVAYDPSNDLIYAATTNGTIGSIDAISDSNHSLVASINLPEGVPSVLIFDGAYDNLYAYDSNLGNRIYVIDTSTNRITGNISTGVNGTIGGAVYDPINQDLYVAGGTSNSLIIISTNTDSIYQSINIGGNPTFVAYDPSNGYIYVQSGETGGSVHSSTVTIVSPLALIPAISNTIVSTLRFPAVGNGICYNQDTGDIYAMMNYPVAISEISSQTNKPTSTIFLPSSIGANGSSLILYDGPMQLLLVSSGNSLLEFNSSTASFVKALTLPGSSAVSVNPLNGYLYASLISASVILVLVP